MLLNNAYMSSSRRRSSSSSQTVPETPETQVGETASSAPSRGVPVRAVFWLGPNGELLDDGNIAQTCTAIFKRVENPTGFNWKLTPKEVKDKYFDEFKKYYSWEPEWETKVYKRWESKACQRYSGWINYLKGERPDKPAYINEEMWDGLCEYWDRLEVVEKSQKASRNRLSEPNRPGTGISKHKGGSRPVQRLLDQMSQTRGVPPTQLLHDIFLHQHMKADGTPLTKKDEKIDRRIKELAAEQREGANLNKIYKIVVREYELAQKQRVYSFGTHGSSFFNDASSGSGGSSQHLMTQEFVQARIGSLEQQLEEERQRRATHEEEERQRRLAVEEELRREREGRELLQAQFEATQKMMQDFMAQQAQFEATQKMMQDIMARCNRPPSP